MSEWICPNCEAEVDKGFECGASADGTVNPSFVREVDVATLPAGWVPRIKCGSCNYAGKVLIGHHGYQWWMFPLAIVLSCTLVGLIPWFVVFLILGNRTFKACPKCNSRERLLDWDGADTVPTLESEEIWKSKQEADRKAFERNKLTLLAVVVLMLIVSLVLMFAAMADP